MSEWAPRRFWKLAEVVPEAGGHAVRLDGRPVRTPAKAPLVLPTRALAEAVAAEWGAVGERVDPGAMPMTRSANSAIDKVRPQRAEVIDALAAYGDADLTCYRAEGPEGLVRRQAEAWDPPLAWAEATLDARLVPTIGVMHAPQDEAALARLRAPLEAAGDFELTALHDLIALTGSLVIGLMAAAGAEEPEALWAASRVDEDWQASVWGADAEAEAAAAAKRADFLHALRVHRLAEAAA